jgi:hypothetical protein
LQGYCNESSTIFLTSGKGSNVIKEAPIFFSNLGKAGNIKIIVNY